MTMGSGKPSRLQLRLSPDRPRRRRRILFWSTAAPSAAGLNEFQQFSFRAMAASSRNLQRQLLSSNAIDPVCRVAITTIHASIHPERRTGLRLRHEETSAASLAQLRKTPDPSSTTARPIETFDSSSPTSAPLIYNLWRQVLEYFDSSSSGSQPRLQEQLASSTRT